MTKILISPGYGAGWSTWSDKEHEKFALTYQPLIDYLEANDGDNDSAEFGALVDQFIKDLKAEFGEDASFYTGGARDLCVVDVDGPFSVREYDGFESITTSNDFISME